MGGFVLAWFAGESILVWRWVKLKAPPPPGALALSSGLFLALAAGAQYQPARTTITLAAWGLDLAILLQVIGKAPTQVTGWPPNMITDPSVLLPNGATSATTPAPGASSGGTAAPPSVTNGGNGPVTGGVPRGGRGGVLGA
jgi:hypothetical protein